MNGKTNGRIDDGAARFSLAAGEAIPSRRGLASVNVERSGRGRSAHPGGVGMKEIADLERGRNAYREQAWQSAFACLARADREKRLGAEDLELLARAAYLIGDDDAYVASLERAHQVYLDLGNLARAVRCAFWIGHSFLFRNERALGSGWFARAQRVLERCADDCVERGYLRIPVWLEQMDRGNFEDGHATALEAARIGERFGDADLVWLARDEQARALLWLGRVEEGRRLLDEALVAAVAGDLSPIVTGIVYCNTISFCRGLRDVRRVREWTRALTRWCERQQEMVAHNGLCLVHRSEILLLLGDWDAALEQARLSAERFTRGMLNQLACGKAFYCQAEAHRLRGEFDAAEEAYRRASQHGCDSQPGLALMRLAQGKADVAASAIRRIVGERTAPLPRAEILPAYVEIMLAAGSHDLARAACRELDEIAQEHRCEVLDALAAHSRGALALAEGQPGQALIDLRRALGTWNDLGAAHEVARVRMLMGLACRALGDLDGATLELEAARRTFHELGAAPELARLGALDRGPGGERNKAADARGLTARELEVLRLVAVGKSNREIGEALFISEHTVARHVQNIFGKLGVSSRTAASAFAFAHELMQSPTARGDF